MAYILGREELKYDKNRLTRSVQKISLANQMPIGEAENFARQVVNRVESWISDKVEITPAELRTQTAVVMAEYDPEAAYLYENENKFF